MRVSILTIGFLPLLTGCHTAERERPRFTPVASLTTEQLWDVGFQQAAIQDLTCDGMARSDAERLLKRRHEGQEGRIEAWLGAKKAEEIILTLPPCSHFRGAKERYEDSLRELERRLTKQ